MQPQSENKENGHQPGKDNTSKHFEEPANDHRKQSELILEET